MEPDVLYIAFEKGLFLGAFENEGAAQRLKEAREKGGHGPLEIVAYRAEPDRLVTCKLETCGKTFHREKSRSGQRLYCSPECRHKFHKATGVERTRKWRAKLVNR